MDLKPDQSLGLIISRTALRIRTEISRRLKPFGLSPEQGFILNRLGELDGITQKELADRTFKDTPTTARILDRLMDRGLIVRRQHPDDRRAFLIFLTDQGREVRERIVPIAMRMNEDASSGLTAEECKQLQELLNRVQENIEHRSLPPR